MKLIHCLTMDSWEIYKNQPFYRHPTLESQGFIHCSTAESFRFVAPSFREETAPLCFLVIDEDKVTAPVKWEDLYDCGINYPHIYGPLNIDAVQAVVPYLKDSGGNWYANIEML